MKKTFSFVLCLMAVVLMLVACEPAPAETTVTTSGDEDTPSVPSNDETTTPPTVDSETESTSAKEDTGSEPESESTTPTVTVTTNENGGIELPPIPIP